MRATHATAIRAKARARLGARCRREARLRIPTHHLRHARACPGHPRPPCRAKNVDGRDKPGHDADGVTGIHVLHFPAAPIAWTGRREAKLRRLAGNDAEISVPLSLAPA